MIQVFFDILKDHLSEAIWVCGTWLFAQAINRLRQEKKLKERVNKLEERNEQLLKDAGEEKESFILKGFEKISKENFEDAKALELKIEKVQGTIEKLRTLNVKLNQQIISRDAKISQLEIQLKSFRLYTDIIISFIGNRKLLRKKILDDPDFRKLMRDKDIDKILEEVGEVSDSKPRKKFNWLNRVDLLVVSLAALKGGSQ